jgi:hypothetical protein
MARNLFSPEGIYLLGKHKGTHISKLDTGFVQWASLNVDGFKDQYVLITNGGSLGPPKPVKVAPFPQDRPVRKYYIFKKKRMYEAKKPE